MNPVYVLFIGRGDVVPRQFDSVWTTFEGAQARAIEWAKSNLIAGEDSVWDGYTVDFGGLSGTTYGTARIKKLVPREANDATTARESHTPNRDVCESKREFWTNAYMEFCAQYRAEVTKEFPDYKLMEVSNELGKRWMNLTDSEKDEWKTYASEKNLRNGYL